MAPGSLLLPYLDQIEQKRKRSAVIEGELIFRCASSLCEEGNYERSLNYLDEAITRDPDNINRYLFFKAVCLAKTGQLSASMNLWKELKDDFHQSVLSHFIERNRSLPRMLPSDPPIEKSRLKLLQKKPGFDSLAA